MIYLRMLATDLTAIENALARFIARRDRSQLASTVGVFSKRRAPPRKSAIRLAARTTLYQCGIQKPRANRFNQPHLRIKEHRHTRQI
jgi:hypothetical protein